MALLLSSSKQRMSMQATSTTARSRPRSVVGDTRHGRVTKGKCRDYAAHGRASQPGICWPSRKEEFQSPSLRSRTSCKCSTHRGRFSDELCMICSSRSLPEFRSVGARLTRECVAPTNSVLTHLLPDDGSCFDHLVDIISTRGFHAPRARHSSNA